MKILVVCFEVSGNHKYFLCERIADLIFPFYFSQSFQTDYSEEMEMIRGW